MIPVTALPLLFLSAPGVATCGPLLNEIMADPARDWDGDGAYSYRGDEWVEIVNPGGAPLPLEGYFLTDDAGEPVYGFAGTLAPNSVLVIYGSESVAWEGLHGESATGLRLGNDGDTLFLRQVLDGDTLVVDAYTYASHEAEDDRSSGRWPDGGPVWALFDGLNSYGGDAAPAGTGVNPSPGIPNTGAPPNPTAVERWGRIKALFARLP